MPKSYITLMNEYGKSKTPFLFVIDFLGENSVVIPIEEAEKNNILYYINGKTNYKRQNFETKELSLKTTPIEFDKYKKQFNIIHEGIMRGDSFLTNFTCVTKIESNYTLKDFFYKAKAKYKIFFKDQFIVFSPETFIKIKKNKIYAYPMKGTIDASIINAKKKILANEKEKAEHYTIVDLIRNDISKIATNVKVKKFRYIDKLTTSNGELLQVSSKIKGTLPENYTNHLGDYFNSLLPAGSICGAPKKKTLELINSAEDYNRGYYTGIFGYFNGENLDSGVMIRFIEKTKEGNLIYKSGGGITNLSDAKEEYNELLKKIYVPLY